MEFTKADIFKSVAEETNTPYARVKVVADALCEAIIRETAAGNTVRLSPLGIFKRAKRQERNAVNPYTGEQITIEAHYAPKFKPSTIYKGAVR